MGSTTSVEETQEDSSGGSNVGEAYVSCVLLGMEDTGKSTLFKQVDFALNGQRSLHQLAERQSIIVNFLLSFRRFLIAIKQTFNKVSTIKEINKYCLSYFGNLDEPFPPSSAIQLSKLNHAVVSFLDIVWKSKYGKATWKEMHKFPIGDSLSYFMRNLKRISHEKYKPTDMDYLRSYSKTSGMFEHNLRLTEHDIYVKLQDMGGSLEERQKWEENFSEVQFVFYTASLSEFDQPVVEDTSKNRQTESFATFQQVFKEDQLSDAKFFLIFTKRDLLHKKLKKLRKESANLNDFFPELELGTNYTDSQRKIEEYIKEKHLDGLSEEEKARVECFFCSSIKQEEVIPIFERVVEKLLE